MDNIKDYIDSNLAKYDITSFEKLAGDAGFRNYYRLKTAKGSLILMETPVDRGMFNFIALQNFLKNNYIAAPEILEKDTEKGFLLISDLGVTTLNDVLNDNNCDMFYQDAINLLIKFQLLTHKARDNYYDLNLEVMDNIYIRDRIRIFKYWYLEQYLELPDNLIINEICSEVIDTLSKVFHEAPQLFTHNDYHSKNLMCKNNMLSMIDFQDAVIAPYTYDLISLTQDAYTSWPEAKIEQWNNYYQQQALDAGLLTSTDLAKFQQHIDFVALFRHLKNLGIFARLALRDKKTNYLNFIPRLRKYISNITKKYDSLQSLHEFMESESIFTKAES